jgi:hypothetical protein
MIKEFKLNIEIDQDLLNEKAKEFAAKALIKELEDYYTNYDSPFRKAIKEKLKEQKISCHFELPDILTELNTAMNKEHSSIVEKFLDLSFVSDLKSSLELQPKKLTFSEFLRNVLELDHNCYEYDLDKYELEVEDQSKETKKITITFQKQKIEVTVQSFDEGKTYEFCRKPYVHTNDKYGGVNRINSYLLSLTISGSVITEFDVEDFNQLFYED